MASRSRRQDWDSDINGVLLRIHQQTFNLTDQDGQDQHDLFELTKEAVFQDISDNKIVPPSDPLGDAVMAAIIRCDNAARLVVAKQLRQPMLSFPNDPIWSTPVRIGGGLRKPLGDCTTENFDGRLQLMRVNRDRVNLRFDVEERLTIIRIGEMHRGGYETFRAGLWAEAFSDFDDENDDGTP